MRADTSIIGEKVAGDGLKPALVAKSGGASEQGGSQFGPRFLQAGILYRTPFHGAGLAAVGPIADPMAGDGDKDNFCQPRELVGRRAQQRVPKSIERLHCAHETEQPVFSHGRVQKLVSPSWHPPAFRCPGETWQYCRFGTSRAHHQGSAATDYGSHAA